MEPVSYAYDAAGERVARWTRSGTADLEADLFVRDEGGSVLAEWRYLDNPSSFATFDLTREYIPGGDRTLGQMDYLGGVDTLRYLAADHLGSTRVLFDAGGILEDYDFYPFGASDDSNPLDPDTTHLFTGHERDTDQYSTEMDYMHARYYSPNLGRFLSVDPVGGTVGSSQSWNKYAYAFNNPIRVIDPTGLWGSDFHNPLTYYLALCAGRSSTEAAARARADVGLDDPATAANLQNIPHPAVFNRHFMSSAAALSLLGGVAPGDLTGLGGALHSLQDSLSAHRNFRWPIGHGLASLLSWLGLGKDPDNPADYPGFAMETAEASFSAMGGTEDQFPRQFLDALFLVGSQADRNAMILEAISQKENPGAPRGKLTIHVGGKQTAEAIGDYYKEQGYAVYIDGVAY